jgi:hypothetical protein
MQTITLPAHFDGKQILLDVPFSLAPNTRLIVTVLPQALADQERTAWQFLSAKGLNGAYGVDEPEYSLDSIQEMNVEYAGG